MTSSHGKDALLGAVVTLLAFGFCLWRVVGLSAAAEAAGGEAPLSLVLYALGIAASLIAHLVFVGVAARAQGRSATLWVLVALLTFPLGSLVALAVLLWRSDGPKPEPARVQAPPSA